MGRDESAHDGSSPSATATAFQGKGTSHNCDFSSCLQCENTVGEAPQLQHVRTRDDYIREDLSKHRVYNSFENGLQNLLHAPADRNSSKSEYNRIISKIRQDKGYNVLRDVYLEICENRGAIEPSLYRSQVGLYNHTALLINQFCDPPHQKPKGDLLHFQQNCPKSIAQSVFVEINPPENGKPLVFPLIVHIGRTEDSDMGLDKGRNGPRARKPSTLFHYSLVSSAY